jgi:hypothetical protein
MPKGHRWNFSVGLRDYGDCGTVGCAAGVAALVWIDRKKYFIDKRDGIRVCKLAEFFGLSLTQSYKVFSYVGYPFFPTVTPEMVADKLESFNAPAPTPSGEGRG